MRRPQELFTLPASLAPFDMSVRGRNIIPSPDALSCVGPKLFYIGGSMLASTGDSFRARTAVEIDTASQKRFPPVERAADSWGDAERSAEIARGFLRFGALAVYGPAGAFAGDEEETDESGLMPGLAEVLHQEQSRGEQEGERRGTKPSLGAYEADNDDEFGEAAALVAHSGRAKVDWKQTMGDAAKQRQPANTDRETYDVLHIRSSARSLTFFYGPR